jgi:hypothetical protein
MKIELDLTPEQAEKVKKMLAEDKNEWIKKGDTNYYLEATSAEQDTWLYSEGDNNCLKRANVYRTKESVEQAERQRLALGAIHEYVRENGIRMAGFNGYVPNLENTGLENFSDEKFQICGWAYEDNEPKTFTLKYIDLSSHGLIFDTKEDLQKVLDNCKKELEDLLKVDYSIIR